MTHYLEVLAHLRSPGTQPAFTLTGLPDSNQQQLAVFLPAVIGSVLTGSYRHRLMIINPDLSKVYLVKTKVHIEPIILQEGSTDMTAVFLVILLITKE